MRLVGIILVAFLFAGCANPFADDSSVEAGPSRELAETPADLPADVATAVPSAAPDASDPPGDGPGSGGDGGDGNGNGNGDAGGGGDDENGDGVQGSDGQTSAGPGGGASAQAGDATGDHGLRAPDYADITQVALEDRGDALRLTLRFAGDVPQRLPENEVQGAGIDLYRGSGDESAYQVFIDGSSDGWYAYFYTPKGFKKYPGSFGLGGPLMIFEVPWSAMSLPDSIRFSAFCDWTRNTTGVVNLFAEDHAPDSGREPFER
jgi:hypothetical protein